MLRDIGLIFLGYRVLLFSFFLALSMEKELTQRALLVVPSVLYLSLGMYVFLYPGRLRLFKNYGDLLFLPLLVFLSGQKEAILALLPPLALYTSRRVFIGMLFFWTSVGFGFYYYHSGGFSLLLVFLATFLSSLHPDLVEALRKERFYIRNLRKAHAALLSNYSELENSVKDLTFASNLLERLQRINNLEDYLKALKEEFGLRSVSITPLRGSFPKEPVLDEANLSVHVPIRLERGEVYVTFHLNSPMELYDKELLKNLEKAGRLINLFLEGFEEKPQVKVIAV
ncbi:MAG: hypothetical protein RMH93_00550 [Aquificaceae bacterium]|nr:hypothetical protein [Aquificaceae bacterium]MDW8032019.1 hypothetical protein [Aquificaceae bacterium]MDW8294632.1 hypothetical protein [Aquificaceae bacterium]